MKTSTIPKFKPAAGSRFYPDLKQKVDAYFQEKGITKFGDYRMYVKSAVLLGTYFTSLLLILVIPMPLWTAWLLSVLMGFAMAGIGMGVMHDANHGSYSPKGRVNRWLGRSADLLGVSSNNWSNQHNKLHHTYTNIYGHDEDIYGKGFFRFSPDAERLSVHRFQHLYWVVFYGFLTLSWFFADLPDYGRHRKSGLNRAQGKKARREFAEIVFFKVFYVFYMVVLPLVLTDLRWWQVLVGLLTIHFVAGLVLSVIFQLAHVVDIVDHEQSDLEEWAVHQVQNTVNFATGNRWLGWYCGGLNFQVEHHLFPQVCHIHYPRLNAIFKETAKEHGVEYREFKSFTAALRSHLRLLRRLGSPLPMAS